MNDHFKTGDVIQLRPSAYAVELSTGKWSEKYLSEDAFSAVALRFRQMEQAGEFAKTIFGASFAVIEEIEYDPNGQPMTIKTDKFHIFYPEAAVRGEIMILPAGSHRTDRFPSESQLVEDLEFFEIGFKDGLFSVMERENNKLAMYKKGLYMMAKEGKWANVT